MTVQEEQARSARSYKLLLIFGMISIVMLFAGLTSAMVVSKSRPDWLTDYQLPQAFTISTVLILLCSLTFYLAQRTIKQGQRSKTSLFLGLTLAFGLGFGPGPG